MTFNQAKVIIVGADPAVMTDDSGAGSRTGRRVSITQRR
jgi:hypothetical protein